MNGSVKTFIASLIILACSIGFFAGSFLGKPCCMGKGGPKDCPMMAHMPMQFQSAPASRHNAGFPPKHKFNRERHQTFMDSLLQVTPEQKTALEQHRSTVDTTLKVLRKQKMEAEKSLKEALDSQNQEQIKVAKGNVLAAQEALLNLRIEGAQALSSILTPEQLSKFKETQKEMFKHKGFPHRHHPHEPGAAPAQAE